MPFCQNEKCKKEGLHPSEVKFDEELKLVLCNPCYTERHPGAEVHVLPVRKELASSFKGGLHLTTEEGLYAEAEFQGVVMSAQVPPTTLKKLFHRHA